ncbi:lipid-A-disaccharide synthase [Rubinisphaera sp. JC750]|uniref:lipid-A-disaccharide synthase n=1 Tax=Rubinisphaera sp. JC750 TaxID=2898658 RepID=UPI001F01AF55|nr:lipid-A-disaccharide synthase [Rubinisphaera sp. JC750]
MQIFFSVGEPSGDEHAAELIREIKRRNPACECVGYGGEDMEAAGCELHFPLTTMAVMGITQVLPLLGKFWGLGQRAKRYFREHRPDAVVLVDFPGFNWWIAYYAKQQGIPVYYYMPPQLWAWGSWRVWRVKKYVDHVLSGLEFETEWYQSKGVQARFVGHPFFEETAAHPVSQETIANTRGEAPKLVGLLPGSRTMEVNANWPVMLQVIEQLHEKHPECRFKVANYKPAHRDACQQMLAESGKDLPIEFEVNQTSEIIAAADCCLMVSGSVSLELLARKTPAVVMYKGGYVMGTLAKWLVNCKYMTLPNLIADKAMYPEFPFMNQDAVHAASMADILDRWLSEPEELAYVTEQVSQLADEIAHSQASVETARYLLETLGADGEAVQEKAA